MNRITCDNCHSEYCSEDNLINSQTEYYIYCKPCIKQIKICSKTKAIKLFKLNNDDFFNIKKLYIDIGQKIKHVYYKYSDIQDIIINKYGSLDAFKRTLTNTKQNTFSNLLHLKMIEKKD